MELLKGNLYMYSDSPSYDGKWILANISVNSNGVVQIFPQNESKVEYHLSSNWNIQAPNDTVWHKIPPLPYRRSVKETFGIHEKRGKTIWFLAMSEHDRNNWFTILSSFTKRKPPPYGDYDNWSYPQDEPDFQRRCSVSFHSSLSLAPQHRSGFYSVHESEKKVPKFVSVPPVTPIVPSEQLPQKTEQSEKICCHCCSGIVACLCTAFTVCLQQMCLSISAGVN